MNIKKLKKKKGFTLLELMVVVIVLGTLIAILLASINKNANKLDMKTAKLKMSNDFLEIKIGIMEFEQQFGRMPTSDEGLMSLVEAPPGVDAEDYPEGGFLDKKTVTDPFNHVYYYEENNGEARIISLGADGQEGGSGKNKDIDLSEIN